VSVGLYMDVHVPVAVTHGLLLRNVDVMTSQLDGTTEMEDPDLLDRARALARVLVTQEDLLAEASRRQRNGVPFSGVFYAHQLGITIGRFANDREVLALVGEPADFEGRVEFLAL